MRHPEPFWGRAQPQSDLQNHNAVDDQNRRRGNAPRGFFSENGVRRNSRAFGKS